MILSKKGAKGILRLLMFPHLLQRDTNVGFESAFMAYVPGSSAFFTSGHRRLAAGNSSNRS